MEVELSGVSKAFGSHQALKPLDIKIRSGSFTTLLGPSGCGKTTLLRLIAGLERPDTGRILLGQKEVFSAKTGNIISPQQRELGMVFQDFALWPHMTVYENIAFGLRAKGTRKLLKDQVAQAIEAVRLQGFEKRYPHQLSGGQQQRVAFARAIATRPQLILFDEPLSALDALLRDEMRDELVGLVHQFGLTAVYVTHDQIEAMTMSDNIIVMQQGEVRQVGHPEIIYNKPTHPFVAQFVGKSNWIKEQEQLVRPEHIHWDVRSDDIVFQAEVKKVSYLGDRYEITLQVANGHIWTGFRQLRMTVGDQVKIGISSTHIHHLTLDSSITNQMHQQNREAISI